MSVEAPTEARSVAPAAQPEGSDRAVAAAHAAEKALGAAPDLKPAGHDPDREIAGLINAVPEARNPALRKAINRVVDAKLAEVRLARADTEAGTLESHDTWQQSRSALEEAANDLAFAPISGAHDATLRAQCFIDAVGRNPKTDQPIDDAGDLSTLAVSMIDALAWLGHREPDPDHWDDLVAATKAAMRRVDGLDQSLDSLDMPRIFIEPGLREDTEDQRAKAAQHRDDLIAGVLNTEPPHIGGVLFQVELLALRHLDDPVDLSTYASRSAAVATDGTVSVLVDGLARIATHLAALRDRAIPHDWVERLEAHAEIAGFDQAARNAIDAGFAASDIEAIHIPGSTVNAGRSPDKFPILQFGGSDASYVHARPDGVWKWEPVQ